MRGLAALLFAAILTPLGLRLVLPFVDLPDFVQPAESLLVWWTDLVAAPFRPFDLPGFLGGGNVGFGRVEPHILTALIGWSIIQGVVLGVIGLLGRRRDGGTEEA